MNHPNPILKSQIEDTLLSDEVTLDCLALQYTSYKAALDQAKKDLEEIENLIIETLGNEDEGSATFKGDEYKITTTGKLIRTLDADKLFEIARDNNIPNAFINRLVRQKPSLDLKEYRFIENNEPEYFKLISKAITVKPAKTAVSVKPI